jgi:hypothetical protein
MSLSVAKARRLKIPTLPNNRINLTRINRVRFGHWWLPAQVMQIVMHKK